MATKFEIERIKELLKADPDNFADGILDMADNLSDFQLLQLGVQLHQAKKLDCIGDIAAILETSILEAINSLNAEKE